MEKKREGSKMPLLYIIQPAFQEPKKNMQTHYTGISDQPTTEPSRKGEIGKTGDAVKPVSGTKRRNKQEENKKLIFQPETSSEDKEVEQTISAADYFRHHEPIRQPAKGLTPVKPFPSMSVDEKLHYLSMRPSFYYCRFITLKETYIGKLFNLENEAIVIESTSGEYKTIKKEELLDIRIMA